MVIYDPTWGFQFAIDPFFLQETLGLEWTEVTQGFPKRKCKFRHQNEKELRNLAFSVFKRRQSYLSNETIHIMIKEMLKKIDYHQRYARAEWHETVAGERADEE